MSQDFQFSQNPVDLSSKPSGYAKVNLQTPIVDLEKSKRVNRPESKSFLGTALSWQGSVTPKVLPRVIVAALYALAIITLSLCFLDFLYLLAHSNTRVQV